MTRALAWIGLVLGVLLLGGWYAFIVFNETYILARNPENALDVEVLHGIKRLILLWPLILAGALISAIPAWLSITGRFLQWRPGAPAPPKPEHIEPDLSLQNALQATQERLRDAQRQAEGQTKAHREKCAQIEARAVVAEQCLKDAQQDAAQQLEIAQARAEQAEIRAQRATHAFQRVKWKLKHHQPGEHQASSATGKPNRDRGARTASATRPPHPDTPPPETLG
ncbi:MAG TPA: hypothetical protein P5032_14885 [Candidatus Competibacter sp.]|nr:hypothetical protein [Candidatus Competibacter sp.]